MGNAVRKRVGLAGACTSDDQQGSGYVTAAVAARAEGRARS